MNHYEKSLLVKALPQEIFAYADDFKHFSSHMSSGSWMMGGGSMEIITDNGNGQKIGSHVGLRGSAFGIKLSLDEVVAVHESPYKKIWHTIGTPKLLVIGNYQMGFLVDSNGEGSRMKVFIDYELPTSFGSRLLGFVFGKMYAKWCVEQMLYGTSKHFIPKKV